MRFARAASVLVWAAAVLTAQKAEIIQSSPVVDPYADTRWYARGDVVVFWGNNLASGTEQDQFSAGRTQLGGASLYYLPDPNACAELQKDPSNQDPNQILACGQQLVLVYASPGQINAILPWTLNLTGGDTGASSSVIVVLVRDGAVDAYLERAAVTPAASGWQPFRLYVLGSPTPHLVISGMTGKYTTVGQGDGANLASARSIPYAAITHGDNSAVTTANPVRNGETLAAWLTGAGQMNPCGDGTLCGDSGKVALDVVFRYGSKLFVFPATIQFFGAMPSFPWLQQVNFTVSVCAQGLSGMQPQPLDARLSVRLLPGDGLVPTTGYEMAALPLLASGSAEAGGTGKSFDVTSPSATWQSGCLAY